jgi:signal transduction histidine kinase
MAGQLDALRAREGELLADLRHDLRTPLTVIAGFAAALADGTATGDDAARAARAIEEEAGRLERLVGELGAIERLREGSAGLRPEQLEAGALLDATRERFAAAAAATNVTLEVVQTASGRPAIGFAADRLAVERILANLVANALTAAPDGGHVWLETRALTGPGGVPTVGLSVTDDGLGFPPGAAERVFERFFRADPARAGSGSGLGLAIVHELAAAHGGSAHAENVAPHGARVSVVLPVVPRV